MRLLVLLGLTLALPASAPAQAAEVWRADLRALDQEIRRTHPNPFAWTPEARWDSAVRAVDAALPALGRNGRMVALTRLVALLGDGHTQVQAARTGALALRHYGVQYELFTDGLFIRRAQPDRAGLAGGRVLRIGRVSVERALAAARELVPAENEWFVDEWAPLWLQMAEVVDGLGLVDDPERLALVLARNGRVDTVIVRPAGALHAGGHSPDPIDVTGWADMRSGEPTLRDRRPQQVMWWQWYPGDSMLYVSYRAVTNPHGTTNRRFWDGVFGAADTLPVGRLVIDIRDNTGGNGFFNRYPIQQLLRRPRLDRSGVLYTLIGRRTFSAAQQLANQLEWWTNVTFVGEPTGQRPSGYGDHRLVVLPGTQVAVNISTILHQAPNPFDRRPFVPPAMYTPRSSTDYVQGVDPALEAIRRGRPPLVHRLMAALPAGDTAAVERLVLAERDAPINRFADVEGQVNALGYDLLRAAKTTEAVTVLRLNTRVFPHSPNVWDSLAEALLSAGRRDEAIRAYRRALAIDPAFPPSLEAIHRLEGVDR